MVGGGSVTSSPAGINCGTDCTENYIIHTTVTLTANPGIGLVTGWDGCDASNGNQCTVKMESARQVTANFISLPVLP